MEKIEFVKNRLAGKKIIFDGDSICHATSETRENSNRGWAYRVGAGNGMEWYNYGRDGATITAEMYSEKCGARHWVSRCIDKIHEEHPELDYLIFEGGTNDADLLGFDEAKLGSYDIADYSGNYDDKTFTGALERLFYKAITYYPQAKIGYIVAHKMGIRPNGYGDNNLRRTYFLRAIEVCRKWGVPYLDLWEKSPLNPMLKCYYDKELDVKGNREAGKAYIDAQHLTAIGYDMISPMIAAFVASL